MDTAGVDKIADLDIFVAVTVPPSTDQPPTRREELAVVLPYKH
jgi:hypothetical protein